MAISTLAIDFVAYDKRGQAILLVEATSSQNTSELWAAQFRRNLLEHDTLPTARFFLIATPLRMYFWRQDDPSPREEPPQFTLDATTELKPYFEKFKESPETISRQAIDLILFCWLTDMAEFGQMRAERDSSLSWLSESGLLEALKRARIEMTAVQ
jgi:hypothetical protein